MSSLLFVTLNFLVTFFNISGQAIFFGNRTSGPYKISNYAIFVSTDSIFINDSFVSRSKYSIDYNQGTVRFTTMLTESTKVIARFRTLPFISVEQKYFHNILKPYATTETLNFNAIYESEQVHADKLSETPLSDIDLSGSKTISVDVGNNQGVGLEQTTRIEVKGKISSIDISAMLSDVGNPIPPEGTTKDLSEFDKILVKLQTDKFTGLYGDNDLIQTIGTLGTINKKVIGILFNGHLKSNSINFGYAKSKGQYKRLIFYGQDNKQGPYYLTVAMNNASIVPGSENVYLQGVKINRGLNEDYTIDYSQGSVNFTNRQVINTFSRIEIDFEYATEDYNRYLYNGSFNLPLSDFLFQGGIYSEADDKSSNLNYTLSSDDIAYLSSIGTDSNQVWLSGVKYVGSGYGDYIKQGNIFVYVGIDSGDFAVRFSYVGSGLGNYDYNNSISAFRYIGENQGKYVARVHVQLPEQNRICNTNIGYQSSIGVNVGFDGYFSQVNHNLFSNLNNNRNGFSYQLSTSYNKARIKFNYKRTETDSKFSFPGIYNFIDFNYQWAGIKQESLKKSDEISVSIKPFDFIIINGGTGWVNTQQSIARQRIFSDGKILLHQSYTLARYNIEHYPGMLKRYTIVLTPQYKIFYPGIGLFWETTDTNMQRYVIPYLLVKSSDFFEIKLGSDFKESNGRDKKSNLVYKIEGKLNQDKLTLDGTFGYQVNKFNNINKNKNFFGNFSGQISLIPGLSILADYNEQQGETQTFELNYVWVGIGLGNYKRNPETRQYYFDQHGDYNQELVASGNFITSKIRTIQANWSFYHFSFINFDGYYSINSQKSSQEDLAFNSNHQLDFSMLPFEKALSLRYINTYNTSIANQYILASTKITDNNNRIEFNSQKIDNLPFKLSFEYNRQITERMNVGIEQNRTDEIYNFSPNIGFGLDIRAGFSYTRSIISEPFYYANLGIFLLNKEQMTLERNWEITKATNLNTNISLSRRTTNATQLPYDINLFEPIGITPEMKLNIDRIFESSATSGLNQIILSGSYSFIKYSFRPVEQNFSLKLQANF